MYMDQNELLKIFLPEWLFDYFDLSKIETSESSIDFYLDEKKIIPENLSENKIRSNGFTGYTRIQDFPIKGKAVYLHIRKREWIDCENNKIHTAKYDINFKGTQLTKEFVAFLKSTNK